MEFFKSQYYTPILERANPTKFQILRDQMRIRPKAPYGMAYGILIQYCAQVPTLKNMYLSREVVTKEWEPVPDLTRFKTSHKHDFSLDTIDDAFQTVYFHKKSEFFICLLGDRIADKGYDEITTKMLFCPHNVDSRKGLEILLREGVIYHKSKDKEPSIGVLTRDKFGFKIKYNDISYLEIDFDTMYGAGFKDVSDRVVSCVQDEDITGLIILHGHSGTGKTNYIRWLSSQAERPMVFVPPDMVTNLTHPDFLEFLLKTPGLTFIVEDAEATLSPRMGSEKSIVSSILNLTDGLLGDVLKCQFIATFNTELTNIDSALLRPGRLLVRHEFTKLSIDEANTYLSSIGSSTKVDTAMSLAELTNIHNPPLGHAKVDKKSSFGFNR